MKIAVDAMGGDNAPEINVLGAIHALKAKIADEIVLVGDENKIKAKLPKFFSKDIPISIINTDQMIDMHESPAQACRQKKDASIMICARLVKEGKVDAYVTAGNSGAAMAAALINLRRIKGIHRPAIATMMPDKESKCLLLDVGANVDSKAKHLLQFAIMGSVYMEHICNVKNPKVGLLSIGEEDSKGNELSLEAFELLKQTPLNFVGNIEGRDIPQGLVDVVVCDGFVGNVVLKLAEGLALTVLGLLKQEIKKNIVRIFGYGLLRGAFKTIKKKIDSNEYGGAPLLGIDGTVIISHGSSDANGIKNAIRVAVESVKHNLPVEIDRKIKEYHAEDTNE
ncbi:phosphate acyltransferase PlsX [bacterium]